jgi:hypothetical protein
MIAQAQIATTTHQKTPMSLYLLYLKSTWLLMMTFLQAQKALPFAAWAAHSKTQPSPNH